MKRDNSPAGRRYARDKAVREGRMLEAKPGETMRVGRGVAVVLKPNPETGQLEPIERKP